MILITDELVRRPARLPDFRSEVELFRAIAQAQGLEPSLVVDELLRAAMSVTGAGTAGISVAGLVGDPGVFRWTNVVGEFAHFVGGFTPRDFSPCTHTIESGLPQLYRRPERYFPYFQGVSPLIEEGLVVAFDIGNELIGTMWIISHDPLVVFDREHVRVLLSMGPLLGRAVRAVDERRRSQMDTREWMHRAAASLAPHACADVATLHAIIARGRDLAATWESANDLERSTAQSRRQAIDAQQQAEDLIEIGEAFSGELDAERLGAHIARLSRQIVSAQLGAFIAVTDGPGSKPEHFDAIVSQDSAGGERILVKSGAHGLPATSTVVIGDLRAEVDSDPVVQVIRQLDGATPSRSAIVIPVRSRSGALLGAVVVAAAAPHFYTPRHVRMLTSLITIAAQNLDSAHRFSEERAIRQQVQERAQLAQLNGEIGRALIAPLSLDESLQRCCTAILTSIDAAFVRIWTLEDEQRVLVLNTSVGLYTHLDGAHARVPIGAFKIGRIALSRKPHVTNSVVTDPEVGDQAWAAREGMIAFAGYPLIVGEDLVGVVGLFARHTLSPAVLDLLATASIGIAATIARHRASAHLASTLARLSESNRDLDRFTAMASHDLLEPTRTISSFLDLLVRRYGSTLEERGRTYVTHAIEASNRMSTLIHSLLAYARFAGSAVQQVPVPLADPLRDARQNLATRIAEVGGIITCGTLPVVMGDHSLIAQVFQNLLANALKFRRPEIAPVIIITTRILHGACEVLITDNGIGIPEQHRQRIFEMFERLHVQDQFAGTGIGLATCRRILERMHGKIWVDPTSGPGTTFVLSLPISSHSA